MTEKLRKVKDYPREGCICTGEWPKLEEPVPVAANRKQRRAHKHGQGVRDFVQLHIHCPECDAKWELDHG